MRIEHRGLRPRVHASAHVAPTAVLSGDVRVGPESRILFGAVLTADGGPIVIGARVIVMENAVLRGTPRHPLNVGDDTLIGPRAYLSGCTIGECAFLATGASVFNGARIGPRAEVRINGTVHVNSFVAADAIVPIGWVAVGDPAAILPASEHDAIWAIQERLDFPGTVFGLDRPAAGQSLMPALTRRYSRALAAHRDDRILDDEERD